MLRIERLLQLAQRSADRWLRLIHRPRRAANTAAADNLLENLQLLKFR